MINTKDKSMCCGCGLCENVCSKKAIHMAKDKCGFLHPVIDAKKCVDCGICDKHCPVLNHKNEEDLEHKAFAAYAKDDKVRFNGSSGGMFGLLAEHTINMGGIVYGAAFDQELRLKCMSAQSDEQLEPLYKSKYLQSNLGDSFHEVKKQLENGKIVLFVSTPCQVFALKLFLKKEYQNLILVDFVCHGIPSQDLFDKCKNFVEEQKGIKILEYQFRAKIKHGATPHYYKIKYIKNGKIKEKISLYLNSPFYYGFEKYITLRDSCYDCQFATTNRVSDITISDFHNIDNYISGINRFDGVSTVITNSKKGFEIWKEVSKNCNVHEVDFKTLYENKEMMCGSTKKPNGREKFINDLETKPFEYVVKTHLNGQKEFVKKLYYALPNFIRKNLKRLLNL